MGVPLRQQIAVGSYLIKQKLKGVKKYPLVLMLEPLFRCNLACAGCGKLLTQKMFLISGFLAKNVCRQWMKVARRWFQFQVVSH